jgi:hypothetical protein
MATSPDPQERPDIDFEEPTGPLAVPGVGAVIESEFASVSVRLDQSGNSVRLRIEDLRTGRVRFLDALELESIVWLEEGHLTQLLDPSHERWRG